MCMYICTSFRFEILGACHSQLTREMVSNGSRRHREFLLRESPSADALIVDRWLVNLRLVKIECVT